MAEEHFPRATLAIKALAPVLTVVGLLVGLHKFYAQETESRERDQKAEDNLRERERQQLTASDELNYRRALWEKRRDTYASIGEVVGQIAAAVDDDQKTFNAAVKRFDTLYWGGMVLVEDPPVETAMKRLHEEIVDLRGNLSNAVRVKQRAYAVGQACRESLEQYKPKTDGGSP